VVDAVDMTDAMDMVEFARDSHLNTLLALLAYGALSCSHAPSTFLSRLSTSSNDLGENISDVVGSHERLSFRHGMA
jgi:hypothetical protein